MNRSYQLSVYKIKGYNWYVTVQGASPLLTYYDESKFSTLLEKYKHHIGMSFKDHLKKLIWNDLSCRELVEVIYYDGMYYSSCNKYCSYLVTLFTGLRSYLFAIATNLF